MTAVTSIAVIPPTELEANAPLFRLLSDLYPVRFVAGGDPSAPGSEAVVAWAATSDEWRRIAASGRRALIALETAGHRVPVTQGRVQFGSSGTLPRCLRRHAMHERGVRDFVPLVRTDDDELICSLEGEPCWLERTIGTARISTLALGAPRLSDRDTFYDYFNRLTWLRLLPYVHFVKELCTRTHWQSPPLRACVMFDDPNLHAESYGFIDFPTLVRHAEACNYHAAMAMVPADTWYYSDRAAQLVRDNPRRISLLIHGNDHAHLEFGGVKTAEEYTRILAQALRRIEVFESRTRLEVARIMAPPYGAFRVTAANAMLRLGYDAICVSRSSLKNWNDDVPWPTSFGHSATEFIGEGLPVIPRQSLNSGQEDSYRLAAFLGHPLIPHGHHQDCADGLARLTHMSDIINGLGPVVWSDMTTLSRSSYQTRQAGDTLYVRMLARHVVLPQLDPDIQRIVAVRPWLSRGSTTESLICRQADRITHVSRAAVESDAIPVLGPGAINLVSPPHRSLDPRLVRPPQHQQWAILRRVAAEARDRLQPVVPRWARSAH